ncbi:MAG: ABC transporter ATP-binding protein [Eubacteriaceae bacterium]|nr:ABC transporter ATP-binding protein [Eubacteriaceae bacterium]
MPILSVENLSKSFGGLAAVSHVNMTLESQELVGLIGPNGAGKTTIFNLLTGVYTPTSGTITFAPNGEVYEIQGMRPHQIANLGIARTFQNIRLFKDMTVIDNVLISMHSQLSSSIASSLFRTSKFYNSEREMRKEALEYLSIFNLDKKPKVLAKNLPYGEQRHLEIVRALASKPSLILLDEPAAGMNQSETSHLSATIRRLKNEFGLTILLIEHDMSLVMELCERIYVLDYGMLISQGLPNEIKTDKRVIEAYLGEDAARDIETGGES